MRITLSSRPASQADEDALKALLPEGEITDISQLPSSIPAYLIQVVPELKMEGETVLTGSPMRLGEELAFRYSVRDPVHGLRHYPNKVVAGSYLAVGVIGGSVAVGSLEEVQTRLEQTRDILASENEALLGGLTREDLLGDMFHAGLLGYFAQYQALGHLSALTQGYHFQLATSAGTYGYVPKVTYFFGIPRSLSPGTVVMDLDRVGYVSSVDGDSKAEWALYNFRLGAISSGLEHGISEQVFTTAQSNNEAVSAVRALQVATLEGQRIYHVTPENQGSVLSEIRQSPQTRTALRNALALGKEVIVHTDPIEVYGWRGAGYVIFDPDVGSGAWMIEGGANGSEIHPDDAVSVISWLLSLLENVSQYSWLKGLSAAFSFLIDFVTAMIDTSKCSLSYAIAKLVSAAFVLMGTSFLVLPIVFIFIKAFAVALIVSIAVGGVAAELFKRRWSCER